MAGRGKGLAEMLLMASFILVSKDSLNLSIYVYFYVLTSKFLPASVLVLSFLFMVCIYALLCVYVLW